MNSNLEALGFKDITSKRQKLNGTIVLSIREYRYRINKNGHLIFVYDRATGTKSNNNFKRIAIKPKGSLEYFSNAIYEHWINIVLKP